MARRYCFFHESFLMVQAVFLLLTVTNTEAFTVSQRKNGNEIRLNNEVKSRSDEAISSESKKPVRETSLESASERLVAEIHTFSRTSFCKTFTIGLIASATGSCMLGLPAAFGFEGGVGGLGKTKPSTGVAFLGESGPFQSNDGQVSAELLVSSKPVRVSFEAPWPLLSSAAGLETRDLQQPESAFVQVIESNKAPSSVQKVKEMLVDTVLGQQGKFGAYGSPTDIKVKATDQADVYSVAFTTYTPGLRESERQILIKLVQPVAGSTNWLALVAGTTKQRFKSQYSTLKDIVDSFQAVPAPATQLVRGADTQ